jgi:hypothetical protein
MQGTLTPRAETESSLKADALEVLQVAWKALRRLEDHSDCPKERKSAGIAVSFLDKVFHEIQRGNQ